MSILGWIGVAVIVISFLSVGWGLFGGLKKKPESERGGRSSGDSGGA